MEDKRVVPTDKDLTLVCKDCGSAFIFTAGEQQFFADRFLSPPLRCPDCRQARRQRTHPPMASEQGVRQW